MLAAFVAMLDKQWLNRYLRHAGGSVVERCGDRRHKCDGLAKWPFHFFTRVSPSGFKSLCFFSLVDFRGACGQSTYLSHVSPSPSPSSALCSIVAGTSSYECPFQTSASIALSDTTENHRSWFVGLCPLKTVLFLPIAWTGARRLFSAGVHRAGGAVVSGLPWDISLSGIHEIGQKIGHQTIILLLRIDRGLGDAKHRMIQTIQRFRRVELLQSTAGDTRRQPGTPQRGLQVAVRSLETLRRLNADNARCVSWILRNITDPEAIDSAIRLAGTIRWFDGDTDVEPPFDVIFFCLHNSDLKPYPGMTDRAYLLGRALLQIMRSPECASKYPIQSVPWTEEE